MIHGIVPFLFRTTKLKKLRDRQLSRAGAVVHLGPARLIAIGSPYHTSSRTSNAHWNMPFLKKCGGGGGVGYLFFG